MGRVATLCLLIALASQAKGDAFALELVRRDSEDRSQEPTHFSPTDRFKALITCPPAWRGVVGVVVYQAGRSYVPLPMQTLESCGNRRTLQGAFGIDGSAPARVCAHFASNVAEWHVPIEASGVCMELQPSPAE